MEDNLEQKYRKILSVLADAKGKRRLIFERRSLGKMPSAMLYIFFFTLPAALFFAVFYTSVYDKLGHATSIILFIILSVASMALVIAAAWLYNKKALHDIRSDWHDLFKGSEPEWILPRNDAPYSAFFDRIKAYVQTNRRLPSYEEAIRIVKELEKQNGELIDAIKRHG